MTIDNNQLVTRYYNLKAKNTDLFKLITDFVDQQVAEVYAQLDAHFVDTITIDLDELMTLAAAKAPHLDPAELETAVTNNVHKHLDALGLFVVPATFTDANTVVAKLNFFNHSRYY
ncbi:hypothetical protein ACFQ3L_03095 [Lacticaseibacillus jixianensis]|uniref:Uncharacterized protein n=1 Tax=Lacticaseibacillus jixianensis TaxID=2486012 RepID=A0ABW4B6X1_9LACO|nr:hypothetical protein [Lacticaseibacillus jixianensis]